MTTSMYKLCECDGDTCCGGRGPAVYSVKRGSGRMNVCTRCTLGDEDEKLIIDETYDAQTLMQFDMLGALCVMGDLAKAREVTQ